MSTSTVSFESLSPAELAQLDRIVEPTFKDPLATELYALGLTGKAVRAEDCGHKGRYQKCATGHVTKSVARCGLRSEGYCAHKRAQRFYEDHKLTAEHMVKNAKDGYAPQKFTYLEIELACEPTPAAVNAHIKHSVEVLEHVPVAPEWAEAFARALISGWVSPPLSGFLSNTSMCFAAGFNDASNLILRVLSVDGGRPGIRDQWPQAISIEQSIVPISLVPKFFKRMFRPCIPHSPRGAALMEVALDHIRRLRTFGLDNLCGDDEIMVEDPDTTVISPEDDNHEESPHFTKHKGHSHKCPICGAPIVAFTRSFNLGNPVADLANERWFQPN